MKHALTLLGIFLSFQVFSQFNYSSIRLQPEVNNNVYKLKSSPTENESSISNASSALEEDDVVLWSEDFANGLDGNNQSTDQAWSVAGPNGAVWEYDTDGSNGTYSGSEPFTIDSETKENGWMIFDADKSNPGAPPTYQERQGQLISPYIDLSNDTNVTLSFEHAYRYCCVSNHEMKVYIGTPDGWSSTSYSINELSANVLSGTIKKQIIITDQAALRDSVRIRFDWADGAQTASHYYWQIDDVKIIKTKPYDADLVTAFQRMPSLSLGSTGYRIIPKEQAEAVGVFFGGYVENVGANTIDSLRIRATIEGQTYDGQSNGASIVSSGRDTIFTNSGFIPSATGLYTANIFAANDNNDVNTDTIQRSFSISDYEFARDNADNATALGIFDLNSDGTHQYGNVFDIYANSTLYAVKIRLDNRTGANAKASIALYDLNPATNSFDLLLQETGMIDLGSHTGDWINIMLTTPLELSPSQSIIATIYSNAASDNDTIFINTSGANGVNGESLVQDIDGVQPGVQPGDWLYTTTSACIRLNFDPNATGINVGINENERFAKVNVFPNPNTGKFTVNIHTEKATDITLNITNVLGQSVYSENLSNVSSLRKEVNLNAFEKGLYFINVEGEDGKSNSHKIVIK
ncbi:T9SS type A sorting domain-containing protein [Flavobacteriales bacterium]|nr:T9SS type A sorting domain-containing protein [Flavobacteriales bacterium]